jgi:hypothetical protein
LLIIIIDAVFIIIVQHLIYTAPQYLTINTPVFI